MITATQTEIEQSREIFFVSKPARTIEWFGGVTYQNLDKTIQSIKTLLSDDRNEEIQLLISSFGGPTGIAMTFLDVTRALGVNLVTIGSGDVDSSGIILLLAGRRRFLTKNTTLLLHLAGRTFSTEKRFSTADMEDMLKEDKLKDYQYACALADGMRDKYSPEMVLNLMRTNTVLTAEEAVNMGLAEGILQ